MPQTKIASAAIDAEARKLNEERAAAKLSKARELSETMRQESASPHRLDITKRVEADFADPDPSAKDYIKLWKKVPTKFCSNEHERANYVMEQLPPRRLQKTQKALARETGKLARRLQLGHASLVRAKHVKKFAGDYPALEAELAWRSGERKASRAAGQVKLTAQGEMPASVADAVARLLEVLDEEDAATAIRSLLPPAAPDMLPMPDSTMLSKGKPQITPVLRRALARAHKQNPQQLKKFVESLATLGRMKPLLDAIDSTIELTSAKRTGIPLAKRPTFAREHALRAQCRALVTRLNYTLAELEMSTGALPARLYEAPK